MNRLYYSIELSGEPFWLLPLKAAYRPARRQLLVADLHLGKASHFRKQGIPIPAESQLKDFDKLDHLIKTWEPAEVLLLGDLFHSVYNREWLLFRSFLKEHASVKFILIEGNHDVLKKSDYEMPNLQKLPILREERFVFAHHPFEEKNCIVICGHVHPGLQLSGIARQSVKLPCFCFNGAQLILPAFGELTGMYILDKKEEEDYYVIVNNQQIVKV